MNNINFSSKFCASDKSLDTDVTPWVYSEKSLDTNVTTWMYPETSQDTLLCLHPYIVYPLLFESYLSHRASVLMITLPLFS